MANNSASTGREIKRISKFGLVGIINTLADFAVYNLLAFKFGFDVIQANIISTTLAMIVSFVANKKVVFKHQQDSIYSSFWHQMLVFYIVTAFGLYVLQTGTIHILKDVWTWPLGIAVATIHTIGLSRIFSDAFVVNNGAKAIGTVISLTWNYIMYKKVVFR